MNKLITTLMTTSLLTVIGCSASGGIRRTPRRPPPPADPGTAYALGGAHVMAIPYDEYIRQTGAHWFPGMKREGGLPGRTDPGPTSWAPAPGIGRVGE